MTFPPAAGTGRERRRPCGIVVLGTDQGMIGQFNEQLVAAITARCADAPVPAQLWVVGERARARLENAGLPPARLFPTPQSAEAIAPLVSALLLGIETAVTGGRVGEISLCHNVPVMRANYETKWTRLLPLDRSWHDALTSLPWPTKSLPEMLDCGANSRSALISEHLFVSLYQACAASCAAENAARLAAMQRAEKNIDDRRRVLDQEHNHKRQSMIDEELFDLISGFEALMQRNH